MLRLDPLPREYPQQWLGGGVVTDTPNVKAATAQTATVRLSPSSSFLGYDMVPASYSPDKEEIARCGRAYRGLRLR